MGMYISQDPIGLLGGMVLYGYVGDVNGWLDVFGLYSDLKHTGDGHHLFPRAMGDFHGIRDIIEGVKWYPDISKNTATLHKELHDKLKEAGIPRSYISKNYSGTLEESLNAMEKAYKKFETIGFLKIDDVIYPKVTPSEAMKIAREHTESKIKKQSKTKTH